MPREQRPWCRKRWEIIYQALTAPRQAEDIAKTVGVSLATVHQVISSYKRGGGAAIEAAGKGGRRRQYLTLEQERAFLRPFLERAAAGELTTAVEIQFAFEALIGHQINNSTLYRLASPPWLRAPDGCDWQECSSEGGPAWGRGGQCSARATQAAVAPSLGKP